MVVCCGYQTLLFESQPRYFSFLKKTLDATSFNSAFEDNCLLKPIRYWGIQQIEASEIINASINSFQPIVAFYVETSRLIFKTNQMSGFNMKCNTGLNWVTHMFVFASRVRKY